MCAYLFILFSSQHISNYKIKVYPEAFEDTDMEGRQVTLG